MMLAGGAIVGGNLAVARAAHAYGTDTIRIALVGCGQRGTAATMQALETGGDVRLVAMADVFANNIHTAYRTFKGRHPDKVDVDRSRFVGLDAFQQVMQSDADLVILATPPGFRPLHFEAAVQAGKHVFMEKPVATDAPGVRRVLAAGEAAKHKNLAVHVGLQRRHESRYRQCIDRLQEGAIGDLIFARVYWNGSGVRPRRRKSNQTELEYQLRNWHFFHWLGGDPIDEQHIHNLDVINWLKQSHPVAAQGQGGREVRRGGQYGQTFDHHMIEFTFADGFKVFSQCRQIPGCWNSIAEHVHGCSGTCDIGNALIRDRSGKQVWKSDAKETSGKGWQQQQCDLFAALRRGETPNEVEYAAHSTMTAILGRMATYSGQVVRWDQAFGNSRQLADTSAMHSLHDHPPVRPDASGRYAVAVPGTSSDIV